MLITDNRNWSCDGKEDNDWKWGSTKVREYVWKNEREDEKMSCAIRDAHDITINAMKNKITCYDWSFTCGE